MAAFLVAQGFSFEAADSHPELRESVLSSAIYTVTDIAWLEALVSAGAKVDRTALAVTMLWKDSRVLEWLLSHGGDPNDPQLLREAARLSRYWPSLALTVLNAGATGPSDPQEAQQIKRDLVYDGAAQALRLFLARQPPPPACPTVTESVPLACTSAFDLLSLAVGQGFPDVVRVLVEGGYQRTAVDSYGYSALHRLLDDDVKARKRAIENDRPEPKPPVLKVIEAASALLEGTPELLSMVNRWGKTVQATAATYPASKSVLASIVAGAAGSQTDLHRAIRIDDPATVASLVAKGASLDTLDGLGRTPLTLALQQGRWQIASFLLDEGAAFTLTPRNAAQSADVSYASVPDVALAFLLRLLRNQILDLHGIVDEGAAKRSLDRFQTQSRGMRDNVRWAADFVGSAGGPIRLEGTQRFKNLPLLSDRLPRLPANADGSGRDLFWFRQDTIGPIPFELWTDRGPWFPGREFIFTVVGKRIIPACGFDFATDRACYPKVAIENTNTPSNLSYRSSSGYVTAPSSVITVEQGGRETKIGLGEAAVFDRSLGDLAITVGPVTSRVLEVQAVAITAGEGPSLDYEIASFALPERMEVYAAIARYLEEKSLLTASVENAEVRAKTLATAIHLLSAKLVTARTVPFLVQTLKMRAADIVQMDSRLVDLHRVLYANTVTPADLDLAIQRIDLLLPQLGPEARARLNTVREQIVAVRTSAGPVSTELTILNGTFSDDLRRLVREYQALILELAQYLPNSELQSLVSSSDRAWIESRLQASDVVLDDNSAGERGASLRTMFGLPAPQ